ncbi:MAG TPA: hypothetical protein VMT19_11870 [Thermoanaerobaculaceae bacterium]|nr:hypothetical protein [Thermoanaerobaculaceae bacterium]
MTEGALAAARATGEVLAFTLVTLAVCWGLGQLLLRIWRAERRRDLAPDTTAWIGWGAAVAVIQIWHLALRPGWVLALLLCCAGAVGLLLAREEARALASSAWRSHAGVVVTVALAAVWLANTSLAAPRNGDSGLYHFQAVRWAAAFPDVPGLANLLGRLGFTSSYTLYLALPEALAGIGRACHLANAALFLLPIARGAWALARLADRRRPWRAGTVFDALAVLPLVERVWSEQVLTSATPDLPVFVLGIVATSLLLRTFEEPHEGAAGARAAAVVWLAAVGVTVKLSFAGFAAAAAALAVVAQRRAARRERAGAEASVALVPLALSCAAVLVPWLARSMVLSGYPLYPFPGISVPVDWRLPRAAALEDYNWVRSWARHPGADWHAVLGSSTWFPGWLRRVTGSTHTLLTFCLPLGLAAGAAIASPLVARKRPGALRLAVAAAPAVVSLVLWFLAAPEPRLAGSAAWCLGLGLAAIAVASAFPDGPMRAFRTLALLAGGIVLATFVVELRQRGLLPVAAGPDAGFHPARAVETATVPTAWGLEVHVPIGTAECWNAPLPCTPWLDPALRLRRDGDLASGFTVASAQGGNPR